MKMFPFNYLMCEIVTKKHMKVEIILEVKTSLAAYALCQREKE